jgi:hypothetical protein
MLGLKQRSQPYLVVTASHAGFMTKPARHRKVAVVLSWFGHAAWPRLVHGGVSIARRGAGHY